MEKRLVLLVCSVIYSFSLQAQSPLGTWVTIDDKRQVDIAHVKIYKQDDMIYGKVVKLLPEARNKVCEGCPGDKKDKSIVGMTLIWDVKRDGEEYWSDGTLMDPKSGRQFDCALWLDDPNTLKVRASFGISLLGRTQTWKRLK